MGSAGRRALIVGAFLSFGLAWLGCWRIGITVAPPPPHLVVLALSFFGLAMLRRSWWPAPLIQSLQTIELLLLLALIGYTGALASYVIFASTTGYVDADLAAMDAALGVDWLKVWQGAARHDWVMKLGHAAYNAFFLMPLIIIPGLLFTGRTRRAYDFLLVYSVGILLTDALFAAFPAQAAFAHFLPGQPALWGAGPRKYLDALAELRAGTLHDVDIEKLSGIVTFPSFHAAAAFIFIWASWPLKMLRLPLFVANTAMMVSITFIGGHYVIDLIGGVVVACIAVAIVRAARMPFGRVDLPELIDADAIPAS